MSNHVEKLVASCLEGDEKAWAELVQKVTPVIFSVCRRMRQSRQETLDTFGQVCYLLLKNLSSVRSPDKLLTYVATVTRREVLSTLRRGKLLDDYSSAQREEFDSLHVDGPEKLTEVAQDRVILIKAIMKLPPKQGKLIWHLFLDTDEPTYERISELVGIPVASIGATRARALAKLESLLKDTDYGL